MGNPTLLLNVVYRTPSSISTEGAMAHLVQLVRAEISCPSLFGVRSVQTVSENTKLHLKWQEDVRMMALRIKGVRALIRSELETLGARGDWSHIEQQICMFSLLGLSCAQVQRLRDKHHIYFFSNAGMSLSGLNESNVANLAHVIRIVLRESRHEDSAWLNCKLVA
jgi:aspartate/tyrosine/aromatic aminotransferase